MQCPTRSQCESYEQLSALSDASGIRCTEEENMVRPEYAEALETRRLLELYGGAAQRAVQYGEVDFDLDLQGAYAALDAGREAWLELPDKVRRHYGSPEAFLSACARGEVQLEKRSAGERKERSRRSDPPPPVPAGGSGGAGDGAPRPKAAAE